MFAIEEYADKGTVKAVDSLLAELDKLSQEYIAKRERDIINFHNKVGRCYLDIGKALFEVRARIQSEEEDGSFQVWVKGRVNMAVSTAYAAIQTYQAWTGFDFAKLQSLFSPSILLILNGENQAELRQHIFDLAANGNHISAGMARNALNMLKHGVEMKKLTVNALRNPDKLLGKDDAEKPKSEEPVSMDMAFKDGNNIEVIIKCHCEERPDDAAIIDALANTIEKIRTGNVKD